MILLNLQPPEPARRTDNNALDVQEVFGTIQGEGPFAGAPAVFVRLAGCQLQCPGCDTDYTSGRRVLSIDGVMKELARAGLLHCPMAKLVVLTGGEPFRQAVGGLCLHLIREGFLVQVETNGGFGPPDGYPLHDPRATIVCSPKTPSVNAHLRPHVNDLKYVVRADDIDPKDGLPKSSLGMPDPPCRPWPGFKGTVWLQPADEGDVRKNAANAAAAARACLTFGHRLCLQVHKLVGLP